MKISVVSSQGVGNTTLSSFDNALKNAGVYNYNLLCLSSVIPENCEVVKVDTYVSSNSEIGWRLYVVRADIRSEKVGSAIGAGIGWYMLDKGGVFVEHEIERDSSEEVKVDLENMIKDSIKDLCTFRGYEFLPEKLNIETSICDIVDGPTCALVLAVYKSEPW